MVEHAPMPVCPMAGACQRITSKPASRILFLVPGIVLILFGVAVLIEPRILAWLVGLLFIAMGCIVLMFSRFMRGFNERMQDN